MTYLYIMMKNTLKLNLNIGKRQNKNQGKRFDGDD